MVSKIGLFGFYKHGNFGDDLMALLFSRVLKDSGYRVISFACRPDLAAECGIEVVASIDALVNEADAIVYGGGGILVPHEMKAGSEYSAYRRDLAELVKKVEQAEKPLAAYSIGGTGAGHDSLPEPVNLLIGAGALSSCTLRLRGDQAHFDSNVPPPAVYPDVVLQTSAVFPFEADENRAETDRYVIGVNVGRRYVDQRLCRILRLVQRRFRRVDIKFFDTFTQDSPVRTEEMRSAEEGENVRYTSVRKHLEEISKVEMLFTHKLHIGVAALSYGIPTISWVGSAKARSFLTEAGAGGGVVGAGRQEALLLLLKMLASGGRSPKSYKPDLLRISWLRDQSVRHFEEMTNWIELLET